MRTLVRLSIIGLLALMAPSLTACQTTAGGSSASNLSLSSYAHPIDIAARKPWSINTVKAPDPVRAGEKATRFEIRHGDCGGDGMWDDCTSDRGRVEMIVTNDFDRVGQESWYGFSVFIPDQFKDIDPANLIIFQLKAVSWRDPLAYLNTWRGHLTFNMAGHERCGVMPFYEMRNKWTDFVFHVKWSRDDDGVVEFWINGSNERHKCSFNGITAPSGVSGPVHPHWGIYQSYVSRWLVRNARDRGDLVRSLVANPWIDVHEKENKKVSSYTDTPFKYDWGVELPTAINYFDEIRMGNSREAVDIRMIEARGGEAVD